MALTRLDQLATVIIGAHVAVKDNAATGSITWAKAIAEALIPHGLQEASPQPQRVALQLDVATALAKGQVKEIAALARRAGLIEGVLKEFQHDFEGMAVDSGYSGLDFAKTDNGEYVDGRIQAIWDLHMGSAILVQHSSPDFSDLCKPGAC